MWVQTKTGEHLHRVEHPPEELLDAEPTEGTTVCGVTSLLVYPGVFSRLGAPRCKRCCKLVQIPAGNGTPRNASVNEPPARPRT